MKNLFHIGFWSCLILFSCSKNKEIQSPSTPKITDLAVIWKTPLFDSTNLYGSMSPILSNGKIVSSFYQSFSSDDEVIFATNTIDGTNAWSWDDYIRESPQRVSGAERVHLNGDKLLVCSSQDNYSIDISTGQTDWATNIEDGNPRTSVYDDLLFHTITYGVAPYGDSTKIIFRPIGVGEWKDVFQINKTDQFEVHFEPPSVFINQNDDTLLIFQNRQIIISPFDERVDLYCYNITADSISWVKYDITTSGSSNVRAPLIENELVYFGGKWDFICLDIYSGEVQWIHNFYHDFQGSNFIIYNHLIITNLDNGDLIAINKYSGTQEWVNIGLSGCCTELRIYDDRIYFGNDKLYIVDASNGELIYKFKSPHPGGSFMTAIAVDLPNKRMYTTDRIFMYCFELPE